MIMIDEIVGEIRDLLQASEASRWNAGHRIGALKESGVWRERSGGWGEFCAHSFGFSDEWANALAGVASDFTEEDARVHTVSKLAVVRKAPREWWPDLLAVEGGKRAVAQRLQELRAEARPTRPPRAEPPAADPSWQRCVQTVQVPIAVPTLARHGVILHQGDVETVLRLYANETFDACICDPPYGFTAFRSDGEPEEWEQGDVPGVELWRQVHRVLRPGSVLFAASGARTYHKIASAIEDAGFEIRDPFEWIYTQSSACGVNEGQRLKPAHEPYVTAVKQMPGTRAGRDRGPGLFTDAAQGLGGSLYFQNKVTRTERGPRNDHPTLKPLALTEHLARLIRHAPDAHLLVPFSGAGSEIIGAQRAGWSTITGIEREERYVRTAALRIDREVEASESPAADLPPSRCLAPASACVR